MTATKEEVMQALKTVQDPELKRDIVSLGMLRQVDIENENVFVQLEMAGGSPSFRESVKDAVRERVGTLEGVRAVTVEIAAPSRRAAAFAPKMPIPGIRHVIAVASGKGGVGKTTVAVNLALALARSGEKVGLMDGDIYGPNVPMMLGVPPDARPHVSEDNAILPIEALGIRMISMGVLVAPDQPMVWRGPMLHKAVTQFLQKVDWGNLDTLLVDLPPGTGDVQLSLVQTVPLSGAVMVTTPQEVALLDVRKGIAMFRKSEVPILGVIENMTGEIFGHGGGQKVADQFQVPSLGEIPLDRRVREAGDTGRPVVISDPESPASKSFMKAAAELREAINRMNEVKP